MLWGQRKADSSQYYFLPRYSPLKKRWKAKATAILKSSKLKNHFSH